MLSNKFKLNVRNIFLYQRNGNNILSIKDIPWNENTILVCILTNEQILY